MPFVSIITPVFNEKEIIIPFLRHLSHLEGEYEIIIVDGGSTDDTRFVIEESLHEFPEVKLLVSPKGRSIQMNNGAAAARGDIFLFLHADCTIAKDSIPEIIRICSTPEVAGGAFTHTHDEPGFFPGVARVAVNLFSRYSQTFFGDFGIFVKRDIFTRTGGFDLIPYCEDVEFCRSARRSGRLVQIGRGIHSSPRRFRRFGRNKLVMVYTLAMILNMLRLRPQFLYRIIID